ncbi:class I SAM-dependent methyltransferase [Jannaschia sp. W003]|uniref:class I SAM-dependent methyltransferase n=1 Tax=Jannaschia sp. W003 TaxID=2867012 RepID=UPI0021A3A42A|nr:class I SAM-dependent methyltransferase [Jannaschia sp. W003]UWQ22256.1 DUF938 domain-containing protein [Jannaschia sp. W003]
MRRLDLPDGAARDGAGLLHAPSAERNLAPILAALLPALPCGGVALELASGTGQHAAAVAAARPALSIQPTEPDPERRRTIDRRCAGLPNVAEARALDACAPGWAEGLRVDALWVVNLLHLVSEGEMAVLLDEGARAVAPGGLFAIYGPFLRGGRATSAGDRTFDATLRAQDPEIGFKEVEVVEGVLSVLGFAVERREMPANNLLLLARRGG